VSEHGRPPGGEAALPATGLAKSANAIEAFIKPIYTWLAYVGAAVLACLVVAMVYSVFGRRFFGAPLPGSGDIIEMSLLILTFTVLGLEHMGHEKMTVDIVTSHLPKTLREIIQPIIYILVIGILCVAVWQMVAHGMRLQARNETTPGALHLPRAPFIYLGAFGIFTLIPIFFARLLKSLDRLVKR
jgi:TRAP-type C4-dicarboxylate transport system permease small subunit